MGRVLRSDLVIGFKDIGVRRQVNFNSGDKPVDMKMIDESNLEKEQLRDKLKYLKKYENRNLNENLFTC